MNHVLDYKGYRFFQSSYDMDEKGSILSVNHDPGTLPTYIGYLLLAIGFIWSYLSDKGRIKTLLKRLRKLEAKNSAVALLSLFMLTLSQSAYSASIDTSKLTQDELKTITSISKEHANNYSRLIVQSNGGRMEPLDTLNKEVVRKLSSKSGFLGLDYNQITIGMLVNPDIYKKLRFIKVTHPLIAKKIGLDKSAKYASFDDFFTDNGKGDYKLLKDVDIAKKKRPALQNVYDKELIKIDEKLNVLYLYQQGFLLKLFPKPNDPNNSWYNPIDAMKSFSSKDSQVVKFLMGSYFESVLKAQKDGNWTNADKTVHMIANFQKFYGSAVIPPKEKVDAEIFYNRVDIFSKLILAYIGIGLVLLVTAFVSIVKPKLNVKIVTRVATALLVVVFLIHTAGLILRWYIAGHAPWSNAYESILFIAWATALAGFVFAKKSPISFAATSILAGVFLFVAFLSSLNPQITNLVPVLKSYWLMIHVAVITSSYGFLALGALLGMFVLALFIIDRNRQTPHIIRAVKELTIINEITLIIGLGLLTVGNFLGGVWANESWGRYWGWDPKETWAAVTILVYAAVVHMRFVPALNSIYKFNVAAILAYFSVIMTYFGVNYYLSGMHSYAAGDPVPIPVWTYYAVAFVFLLIIVAKRFEVKGKL
jgi:cytochrome c-type biogenesis protein CcsB